MWYILLCKGSLSGVDGNFKAGRVRRVTKHPRPDSQVTRQTQYRSHESGPMKTGFTDQKPRQNAYGPPIPAD
jgi:hypothetical protein